MARNTPEPIQQFRGSAASLDTYTGPVGELTVDTTNKTVRVQDGAKQGGHPLVNTTTAQAIGAEKTFVDSPLVPTVAKGDNSTKAASTAYVDRAAAEIDIDSFPKTSKDNLGTAQIGYGLSVTQQGVVHVGMISRPSVIAPLAGADVFKTGSLTVETSPFSTQFSSDTHVSTDYLITSNYDRSGVVLQAIGSTDKTSHTFADLSALAGDTVYYIHVRHNGANSSSDWSAPVDVTVRAGQVFAGRTVYRHPNNKGSVIIYDEFGTTKQLFVADAAYRGRKYWQTANSVDGLNYWPHQYYMGATQVDKTSGHVNLASYASLDLYANILSDTFFQAALRSTLQPVLQTAKEATDLMIADGRCPAANFVRSQSESVGIEMQLPNIYQALVLYACGDYIDSLDPTVASYSIYALGRYSSYRWYFQGSYAWSSTPHSYGNANGLDYGSHTNANGNAYAERGVIPVAEL